MTQASLATLVPSAAASAPQQVAVVDGDRSVTYAELDALASTVAARLTAAGVVPGDTVVLHLPKSLEAIAAIHGVLRAGAAYVPLDPRAPAARLEMVLDDAGPSAAIVGGTAVKVWTRWQAEGRSLPPVVEVGAGDERAGTIAPCSADDLAYVLYTSGSTGVPKGVELTHGNALAFVDWAVEAFAVVAGDRLSSHAPLHFDLSIFDVFAAAAAGATLVLVPRAVSLFPVDLARWIADQRISVWYSVPTALTMLVTRADLAALDLSALRVVLFAGEVFPVRHLAALMAAVPAAEHWNLYGPTETNVCTAHRVPEAPSGDGPPVPIGAPVAGDTVSVVDDAGAPVAAGEVGELVVCGPTVARGYRGAPELTAARFAAHADGTRCYRTGDRVVAAADGTLTYVGRADDQVKTRGHRVELGEVEVALLRHAAVRDGAVVAVPDDVITNRLVGFVELGGDAAPTSAELVRHVASQLPAPMVPERIEVVDRLPRTSTGKIDRPALVQRASGR